MSGRNVTFRFYFGDRVHVDGCRSVEAVVVGLRAFTTGSQSLISWWSDGRMCTEWVDEWRLGAAGGGE